MTLGTVVTPARPLRHSWILLAALLLGGCGSDDNDPPAVLPPTISTTAVSSITATSATSGGDVTSTGGAAITGRGVCWSTSTSPTISDNTTADGSGSGSFTSTLTGLSASTTYYVRAYATNSAGTAYGQTLTFDTDASALVGELLSYWKLDDGAGTIASDAFGAWGLTFVNGPTWTGAGKVGGAVDFGPTGARYLERTGVNSGNRNTYTLAAWIFLTSDVVDAFNIMGMNSGGVAINAGAAEVKLILTLGNKLTALYHTTDGWVGPMQRIGGTSIGLNSWYHVAGVVDNGSLTLYVNGVADDANPVTGALSTNLNFANGRVTLGTARLYDGSYIATRSFRGSIDEAAIWGRALTAGEVATVYNNGIGLAYPF